MSKSTKSATPKSVKSDSAPKGKSKKALPFDGRNMTNYAARAASKAGDAWGFVGPRSRAINECLRAAGSKGMSVKQIEDKLPDYVGSIAGHMQCLRKMGFAVRGADKTWVANLTATPKKKK